MANLSRHSNADKTVVAHRFLDAVFGESAAGARRFDDDAASGAVGNLWTAPDCQSHFFSLDALSSAAEQAVALSADSDVYLGVALLDGSVCAGTSRGRAANTVAIPGLSADVDVKKLGLKKRYFSSRATALDFLLTLVLVPTLLVWSGGGYQPWWLFRELWWFANPADHDTAAALVRGWVKYLQLRARALGVEIDSTGDLARLLRLPGTINHKYGSLVTVDRIPGRRYNPSDFTEFVAGIPARDAASAPLVSSGLLLDPHARPPEPQFGILYARNLRFALSWNGERRDLADQSPSGYDLSLASFAVRDGWTDQEVVDLLIASRTRHGNDPKLRLDYYRRTLQRARTSAAGPTPRSTPTILTVS
jgi:hypothetical protein